MYSGKHLAGNNEDGAGGHEHIAVKPRKKGYIRVFVLWSLLITLVLGGAGFIYAKFLEERIHRGSANSMAGNNKLVQREDPDEPVTFLLLGSDIRPVEGDQGRSDTLMVFRVNPEKKIAYLISIPRDSRVEIPGHRKNKINSAYQYGGADLTIETVQNLTGLDINHYAIIDFKGFKEIIDALDGIDIEVEKPIHDRFEGVDVDFEPGMQHMDGDAALKYVRVRHVDDDFGRIGRQQQFVKAIMEKMLSFGGVIKVPQLAGIAADNVTTDYDLGISRMISYAQMIKSVGRHNIHMVTLPGEAQMIGNGSYVVLDEPKVAWMLERVRNDMPLELTGEEKQRENIEVAVQNGSGKSGMAKKMADKLAAYNFKIGEVGNAPSFNYYETQIVVPEEKAELANVVQSQLGFGEVKIEKEEFSEADVTVIIGKDFTRMAIESGNANIQ